MGWISDAVALGGSNARGDGGSGRFGYRGVRKVRAGFGCEGEDGDFFSGALAIGLSGSGVGYVPFCFGRLPGTWAVVGGYFYFILPRYELVD